MDDSCFDALTRALSSRRTALVGLLGGAAALLGLAPEVAHAHNFTARCRRLPDPAKRRACPRRARDHNRQHQCRPRPVADIRGGRCGSAINNCGKRVACHLCPVGRTCLSNGSCAQSCQPTLGTCPLGCRCNRPEVGNGRHCIPNTITECIDIPLACTSTTRCPLNHFCMVTGCGLDGAEQGRCTPVCQA